MLTITPRIAMPAITTALTCSAHAAPSVQDLVEQRDEADAEVRAAARWVTAGGAVNKTGKFAMLGGIAGTGLGLIGLPIPVAPCLGAVGAGLLLRVAGTSMALNALGRMDHASVRSAGLSQQIAAASPAPSPAASAPAATSPYAGERSKASRIVQAVACGAFPLALFAAPAILTRCFGAPGFFASVVGEVVLSSLVCSFQDSEDETVGMLGLTALGAISGGLGALGVGGAALATAAGVGFGVHHGMAVYNGTDEPEFGPR